MDPLALVGLILLALAAGLVVFVRTRPGGVAARTMLRPLVRAAYSFRVEGRDHVPRRGGALLVANHVSYADAFLLGACVDRPVRFLMHRSFLELPLVGAFTRWVGAIPVASGDTPQERDRALGAAAEALRRGELVAIFAEGRITRTGVLLGFRRGLEAIARQAGAPIVPVALDEVWGSIFSFSGGRAVVKRPRRVPRRVRVAFGQPLPPDARAHLVRDAIAALLARSAEQRALEQPDMARAFVRTARRHAAGVALVDQDGKSLTYAELLAHVLALGAVLRRSLGAARSVGVLLPAGRPAVEVHLALALAGRTVVPLDACLDPSEQAALVARAGVTQVLTCAPAAPGMLGPAELLEVERLRAAAARRIARARRLARRPAWWIERRLRGLPRSADAAVVLATSGTGGAPRATELSHAAIASNARALALVGELGTGDVVLGALPYSHAFGYTVTLWAPLLGGAALFPAPGAIDGAVLAGSLRRARATVLPATPALFAAWLPSLRREDAASLRLAISGGEHLPSSLAEAWRVRLGCELHEGYGATELGPVVSVNLPDVERGGLVQCNHRPGTVGRPLPGVAVRVVREDGTTCEPDEQGSLLVRGPGRMRGYLADPRTTAAVLHEGWFDTGDVGALDRDGFLLVVDRRERFTRVAGVLVAHARVEDALRSGLSSTDGRLAVVSGGGDGAPPLVVVHTPLAVAPERLREAALATGLPPASVPPVATWVQVDALPLQSSGKLDLKALARLARAASPASPA